MRKAPRIPAAVLAIMAAAGVAASSGVLAQGPDPDEIFVDEDTDDFDPGLPIGSRFPAIRARYQDREITDVDPFLGDRGLAFFAMRSADW